MPIYEYACRSCGRRVDVIHGINDPGPTACDVCGGPMAKQLSTPAIVFKGSGWAKKDARAASTAKADRREDDKAAQPTADGGGGGGKAAESKPGSADGASGKSSDSKGSAASEPAAGGAPSRSETKAGPSRSDGAG